MATSGPSTGCQTCRKKDDLPFAGVIFTAEEDLLNRTTGKIDKFLQIISAVLNQGSGEVVVHADKPNLLNFFEEKVDDKLQNMLTDGSCFTDNFERFHYDEKHIVFRIIPRPRFLSTLVSNTKLSRDKGLADPSQAQLQYLNETASKEQEDKSTEVKEATLFLETDKVCVIYKGRKTVFQESRNMQAKRIRDQTIRTITDPGQSVENKIKQLTDDWWERLRVREYISAFSKLQGGGSVYLGLKEKKIDGVKRWQAAEEEEYRPILRVLDPEFKVWKNGYTYCVTKEENVPVQNEVQTGEFICEGIPLNEDERRQLSENIKEKVEKEMLWLSRSRSSFPVKVLFIRVSSTEPVYYVVQIKVEKYRGWSFYRKEGPLAYKLSSASPKIHSTNPNPVKALSVEDWLKRMHKDHKPTLKKLPEPFY